MKKPRIRLISINKNYWGGKFPESFAELTYDLLPAHGTEGYSFTGAYRPDLEKSDTLVFRFAGWLLGEATFLNWTADDERRMIYRPILQYAEKVRASRFVVAGANPYPTISDAKIRKIRESALAGSEGPYSKTGEGVSLKTHRIGQGLIRDSALERYRKRCCLCNIDEPSLLVAGHIRGWAKGKKARSNPTNVVLMCAFHDSLFGKGFISLNPKSYKLTLAKKLLSAGSSKQVVGCTSDFRPPTSHPPAEEFLRWHKVNIFKSVP